MQFAPRISPPLLPAIARLAASPLTPAEITRRLGVEAERHGVPPPCYEQVRVLVRQARRAQRAGGLGFEVGFSLALHANVRPGASRLTAALPLPLPLPRRGR